MAELSLSDRQVFYNVATDLGIANPEWLIDMVRFESGFNPKAKNPFSSARGLIQFVDSTARSLGYADSLDLVEQHPTIASQLEGPVYQYLKAWMPYPTEQSLYMAVFLPIARPYPADTTFKQIYMDRWPDSWESKYAAFKKGNPGIDTIQDYINYVKKKPIIRVAVKSGLIGFPLIIAYLIYRKYAK